MGVGVENEKKKKKGKSLEKLWHEMANSRSITAARSK